MIKKDIVITSAIRTAVGSLGKSLKNIPGDFYIYDEKNYCIYGSQTKRTLTLGDSLKVKIRKVDIEKREIDMVIINI